MDRNLGARDTKRAVDGKGVLTYRVGASYPFPGGTSGAVTTAYEGRSEDVWTIATMVGPVYMYQAVNNPMIWYTRINYADNWIIGVNSESYIWNDFEQDVSNHGKSLFDPSPLGWKVPAHGTWADFDTKMTDWDSNTETMGRSYPLSDDKFAYYPCHGFRSRHDATIGGFINTATYTTSTPFSTHETYAFEFNINGAILPSTRVPRNNARITRPVQHYE